MFILQGASEGISQFFTPKWDLYAKSDSIEVKDTIHSNYITNTDMIYFLIMQT